GLGAVEVLVQAGGDLLRRHGGGQARPLLVGIADQQTFQANGQGLLGAEGGGDEAVQLAQFQEAGKGSEATGAGEGEEQGQGGGGGGEGGGGGVCGKGGRGGSGAGAVGRCWRSQCPRVERGRPRSRANWRWERGAFSGWWKS